MTDNEPSGTGPASQLVARWNLAWVNSAKGAWGDKIDWTTAREIARRIDDAPLPEPRASSVATAEALIDEGFGIGREAAREAIRTDSTTHAIHLAAVMTLARWIDRENGQ